MLLLFRREENIKNDADADEKLESNPKHRIFLASSIFFVQFTKLYHTYVICYISITVYCIMQYTVCY